jgi:GTPase
VFVDHIKIYAKAGNGGDGSTSFRREKFIPRGGPDGGDGGRGADIILVVDQHTDTLKTFFYSPNLRAEHGARGAGRQKSGKSGKDLRLLVPAGTLVYKVKDVPLVPVGTRLEEVPSEVDAEPGPVGDGFFIDEEEESVKSSLERTMGVGELELIADLTTVGQECIIAKGGKGGKGNIHFKTPTHQTPLEFTPGEMGDEGIYFMELRQIADAGLVGFPNAGKSTILSKLSAAKPKVAAYPFTTLKPMVGVVEYPEYKRLTLADIPGLIEGAHDNVGLGHDFLRHILRCRLLLFVLDMAGSEGRHPVDDLATLRTEISLYDEQLAKRPWIVIANKMDLPESEELLAQCKQRFPKVKFVPISAGEGTGLEGLRKELWKRVSEGRV